MTAQGAQREGIEQVSPGHLVGNQRLHRGIEDSSQGAAEEDEDRHLPQLRHVHQYQGREDAQDQRISSQRPESEASPIKPVGHQPADR